MPRFLLPTAPRQRFTAALAPLALCLFALAAPGCGDDDDGSGDDPRDDGGHSRPDGGGKPERDAGGGQAGKGGGGSDRDSGVVLDAGDPIEEPDAALDAGVDAGEQDAALPPPLSLGGLTVNMSMEEQTLDLFGAFGHRFWVEVSNEQRAAMNEANDHGGGLPGPGSDIYTPGVEPDPTFADHILVQDAVTQSVADYGKVEVKLVGESTGRRWTRLAIPNLRIDANEFEKGKRFGTFEHLRLNNSLVGSIFREHLAHEIYRALDYPALRSGYAFLGSNVWGNDVWVPMTLIEVYKRRFCADNADALGGDCLNMWEFAGELGIPTDPGACPACDPGPGPRPRDIIGDPFPIPRPGGPGDPTDLSPESWCQLSECDDTRLDEVIEVVKATPPGAGFQAALDPYVDWSLYRQFQCLSWMMWTGDDPVHGGNNNLIVERDDGKLVWAPYSVDISAGQEWYQNTPLPGSTVIPRGCQAEPSCWAETIATCEDLIARFDALDPEAMLDERYAKLEALGMLRDGDQQRAEQLREWLVWRQHVLPSELERFRYLPDGEGNCPQDMQQCDDQTCGSEAQCLERRCQLGASWCDSLGRCIDPAFEPDMECPTCDEAGKPSYCEPAMECVADQETCIVLCEEMPDMVWCQDTQSCMPIANCGQIID